VKKKIIPVVIVAVIGGAALYFWLVLRAPANVNEILISGNIEVTEVDIAFKTPGKLTELLVREGDTVAAGQTIARLSQEQLLSQRERAQASIAAAESRLGQVRASIVYQRENVDSSIAQREAEIRLARATLNELENGSRTQEVEQFRAAVAQAAADAEQATRDLERGKALFSKEDISAQDFDRMKTRAEASAAAFKQARERLALVEEGPRKEDNEGGRAQLQWAEAALRTARAGHLDIRRREQDLTARHAENEAARAELAVVQTQLDDTVAVTPVGGVVLVKAAEPGEILAAGTTVVTIGDIEHPWLRGYVNETHQGRVKIGSAVDVSTDSFPGKRYAGKLTFIAADAEFTPKQIQTQEERVKLVYRVKIEIPNPDHELKRNMPADARIPLSPAASEPSSAAVRVP
jgi:HlyD family secretion protein